MWDTNCSGLPPTPTPWTPLFIRLPRMADTKSPLNLNLYETTTPTRTDLCRNTLLIIISRLSFYFNFAAPPTFGKVRFLVCGKQRYNKFIVGNTHTHSRQYLCVDIVAVSSAAAAAASVADAFIFHWVHSPFRPQCPLHYLLFIRLCRRDALRCPACPPFPTPLLERLLHARALLL